MNTDNCYDFLMVEQKKKYFYRFLNLDINIINELVENEVNISSNAYRKLLYLIGMFNKTESIEFIVKLDNELNSYSEFNSYNGFLSDIEFLGGNAYDSCFIGACKKNNIEIIDMLLEYEKLGKIKLNKYKKDKAMHSIEDKWIRTHVEFSITNGKKYKCSYCHDPHFGEEQYC